MHIVKLPTAVAKVDIKVIKASLAQNQCLQCETPPLTHVEIPRSRNADGSELNNDGMTMLGDILCTVSEILQVFVLMIPPLLHPYFWGVPVGPLM